MNTYPSSSYRILKVEQQKRTLQIYWADGHKSEFPYIWLRDNWLEDNNRLSILDIPDNIYPESITINSDYNIDIIWPNTNNVTAVYDRTWLRKHCNSSTERIKRINKPILWDSKLQTNIPYISYIKYIETEQGVLSALEQVRDYGFVIIRKVPTQPNLIEKVAEKIGKIKENNYGRIFDLIVGNGPKIGATDNYYLNPHTDDGFRYTPPGIIFFHCLIASSDGGGKTMLVDGFKIAEILRIHHLNDFSILSKFPRARTRYHQDKVDLRDEGRVINLDYEGNIMGIRFSDRNSSAIDLPFENIEPFYVAYKQFATLAFDSKYRLQFGLKPGDLLLFDNHRVLHGRTAFKGYRHMQMAHMDRDEFHSCLRVLGRRYERIDFDQRLPRGAL